MGAELSLRGPVRDLDEEVASIPGIALAHAVLLEVLVEPLDASRFGQSSMGVEEAVDLAGPHPTFRSRPEPRPQGFQRRRDGLGARVLRDGDGLLVPPGRRPARGDQARGRGGRSIFDLLVADEAGPDEALDVPQTP